MGRMTDDQTVRTGRLVVLGAGMAGLAAAAAAADVADEVTVLDRDRIPVEPEFRKGTPQARHVHGLLVGGREALDELLPGLDADLNSMGAREISVGGEWGFRGPDGWIRDVPDVRSRMVTRPMIEMAVRKRVLSRANVRLIDGWQVHGLRANAAGRVTGVVGQHAGRPAELAADLVVDATGRGSPAPAWLSRLGHRPPPERTIDPRLWYASTRGRGSPDLPGDMRALIHMPDGNDPRGGVLGETEDGSYVVTVIGSNADDPPVTVDELRAHARQLSSPALARAITPLDLDDDIAVLRSTSNRARRYDQVPVPPGFVLIGDSVCCFDPIYGQGMTVAALQAIELRKLLRRLGAHHPDLTRQVQDRTWRIAKTAWDMSAGADMLLPTVERSPTLSSRIVNRYVRRLGRLCAIDPEVTRRFVRVVHFLDPQVALFSPALIGRVVLDVLRPAAVPAHPADRPTCTPAMT